MGSGGRSEPLGARSSARSPARQGAEPSHALFSLGAVFLLVPCVSPVPPLSIALGVWEGNGPGWGFVAIADLEELLLPVTK